MKKTKRKQKFTGERKFRQWVVSRITELDYEDLPAVCAMLDRLVARKRSNRDE